jgi:integrase
MKTTNREVLKMKSFEEVSLALRTPGKNWKRKGDSSIANYRRTYSEYERFLNGRTPTVDSAESFLSSKNIGGQTYNTYASALRNYFHVNGVELDGRLKLISNSDLPPVRDDKYVTFRQVNEIVDILDSLQEKVIVRVLFHSGVRPGKELSNLNVGDVDFKRGKIKVQSVKKGKKIRTVTFIEPDYIIPLLKNYLKQRGMNPKKLLLEDKKEPLILARGKSTGKRITWSAVRGLSYKIRGLYPELSDLTPHWFRHGHAVWCKMDGMPVDLCAIQLGNTPQTCSEIYSHFSEVDVDKYFRERDQTREESSEYVDPLSEVENLKRQNKELEDRLKLVEQVLMDFKEFKELKEV